MTTSAATNSITMSSEIKVENTNSRQAEILCVNLDQNGDFKSNFLTNEETYRVIIDLLEKGVDMPTLLSIHPSNIKTKKGLGIFYNTILPRLGLNNHLPSFLIEKMK